MAKQIYINLPVADLVIAEAFYTKLGFIKNEMFSDSSAVSVKWSDDIVVMLLTHDFYKKFTNGKEIADTKKTSAVLLAINFDTKEEIEGFAQTAKENGGDFFRVDMGIPEDQMFGYEVVDPDGHQWEAMWMSDDFNPMAG